MREISYNKKGIPNYDELGTIPKLVQVPTYTVGTIFIIIIASKTRIMTIRSSMILQRYFSVFLILSPLSSIKESGE